MWRPWCDILSLDQPQSKQGKQEAVSETVLKRKSSLSSNRRHQPFILWDRKSSIVRTSHTSTYFVTDTQLRF